MAPFNKIIYINLRDSKDRNNFFRGQLKKSYINELTGKPSVRRFDAFRPTKNDLDSNKYKFFTDRYSPKFLSDYGFDSDFSLGTLGCYLSHYHVYDFISELKEGYYIVCEDDLILETDWLIHVARDIEFAPKGFDIIRQTWECPENYYEIINYHNYCSKFATEKDCSDFTGGLHFQIVNQASCKKILAHLDDEYVYPIDAVMTNSELNIYTKRFKGVHANFDFKSDIARPWDKAGVT